METLRSKVFAPRRWAQAILVAQAALSLSGCGASSSLVNMWRDPTFSQTPMTKVFVIAVKRDPAQRRIWEDGFVGELAKRGVTAAPSYRFFSNELPDTQQVTDVVQREGFDGVLVTHRLPTATNSYYVPGYVSTMPRTRYDPWSGTYYTYYRRVYEPGYTETERIVRYQTDVWSTGEGGKMVWTGTSESIDPSSGQDVNREISALIVPELARAGILPRKK